jgi:hypothetical protein
VDQSQRAIRRIITQPIATTVTIVSGFAATAETAIVIQLFTAASAGAIWLNPQRKQRFDH